MNMALNDGLEIPEEDRMRADMYNFLAAVLARPADGTMLKQLSQLEGDESPLGSAIGSLARVAKVCKPKTVESEFNNLFIGLGRGELLPYASYYLTGFLNEKPLAKLRQDMAARGMQRAPNIFEPEDNIASLMEMMAGMITGKFGTVVSLGGQKTFFNRHIGPWAPHFFSDLEGAKNSVLYASVGSVGREFMDIEREAFRLLGSS
ncbi:molecular chaperone TorD family protein [Halocynthiibacter sp. C4]|uniref:TorD/DmsD family molecular chaperone n=1 Tax=Halocynthiibacter sp. C4 TaxID=2992758 RepID=UPI00237A451A|nr:molecular chaperone TorD family protein [Halocynthiibacter sp. C4]MDE0588879.1 molecular chaperone TorD family protein [Halocynthiibacter sp. C4]